MKTTGTSKVFSNSLTASRPELPSASWISARIRPGFLFLASATASEWVRATPITLAKAKRPGLILADIQLADGSSGLDAVNELLRTFEVPVIFITAYPERFLTGERPEPAFLISKPFQPAMVSAVASQALFFQRNSRNRTPKAPAA